MLAHLDSGTRSLPSDLPAARVAKLPARVEEVGDPALGHLGSAVVVAPRAVVDASQGAQATCRVLLPRVSEAFNDLLVVRRLVSGKMAQWCRTKSSVLWFESQES